MVGDQWYGPSRSISVTPADLLTRLARARPKMDATDQADTDRLLAHLAEACGATDADAVTEAVEELEDILFYLETE